MLQEQGVLEIKKKKEKKTAGLSKNLGNFLEKYIWMNSFVIKLQGSPKLYQKMNSFTCIFQDNFSWKISQNPPNNKFSIGA